MSDKKQDKVFLSICKAVVFFTILAVLHDFSKGICKGLKINAAWGLVLYMITATPIYIYFRKEW